MAGAPRASRSQGTGPLQLQLPMQQPAGLDGPCTVRRAQTRLVRTSTCLAPSGSYSAPDPAVPAKVSPASFAAAGRAPAAGFHVGNDGRGATLGALSRGARRTAVKVGIVGDTVAALDPVRDEIEQLIGFLEGSLVG